MEEGASSGRRKGGRMGVRDKGGGDWRGMFSAAA